MTDEQQPAAQQADQLPVDQQPLALETSAIEFYWDDPGRRPRVIHLLIWLGILGAYIGFLHASRFKSMALSGNFADLPFALMTLATSLGAAAGLFGFVLLLERRLNKMEFPTHVGEYLLLAVGAQYLITFVSELVFRSERFFEFRDVLTRFSRVPQIAAGVVAIVVLVYAWRRANTLWRVFIVVFAVTHVFNCVRHFIPVVGIGRMFLMIYSIAEHVPFVVLSFIVWNDWTKKRQHSWTHWIGVVTQLWLFASDAMLTAVLNGYYYLKHFGLI